MSEEQTARLRLPLLQAGQAQKELDHNEALALLDLAVQAAVVAIGIDAPPSDPALGDCWIVGPDPVGLWAGHADALAGWTAGGWRFVAPRAGMAVWLMSDGLAARFDGTTWSIGAVQASGLFVNGERVVSARGTAVANPIGGATIDIEARNALDEILSALRLHGLIAT
ncbi:DUF2793 domain-containing protein [Sphingomonas radiodurans]|nr:DUF2793 domain-containing protein [Sphingomonas radiodurans]WBH18298.1 DUF2793 domain-containing protein [Sphingomonas radiodurans]